MKKYGLYIVFPTYASLKAEGLGRYVGQFIEAATQHPDILWCIACPEYLKKSLRELLSEFNINYENVKFIKTKPNYALIMMLFFIEKINFIKDRKKVKKTNRYNIKDILNKIKDKIFINLISSKNNIVFLIFLVFFIISVPVIFIFDMFLFFVLTIFKTFYYVKNKFLSKIFNFYKKHTSFLMCYKKLIYLANFISGYLKENIFFIDECEIVYFINKESGVKHWISFNSFGESFLNIRGYKILIVPDDVGLSFPVGFSKKNSGSIPLFEKFRRIIANKKNDIFITYSEDVKINTLSNHHGIDSDKVLTITHGVQADVFNSKNSGMILKNNFLESSGSIFFGKVQYKEYILYASQDRPNKNILTLAKAFNFLLKKKYIQKKLVLTCNALFSEEIIHFIRENNLEGDVLFFNKVTERELMALYHCAVLAVNPSFSEGGFPFTFQEALSMNTPVVMADINVTREVIDNFELKEKMLFNPYDTMDMVSKIEWALQYPEILLKLQKPLYQKLLKRTWGNVASDCIAIFDKIAKE